MINKIQKFKDLIKQIRDLNREKDDLEDEILDPIREAFVKFHKFEHDWVPPMEIELKSPYINSNKKYYTDDALVVHLADSEDDFGRIVIPYEKINNNTISETDLLTFDEIEEAEKAKQRKENIEISERELYLRLKAKYEYPYKN
jgi:hypothetical protein